MITDELFCSFDKCKPETGEHILVRALCGGRDVRYIYEVAQFIRGQSGHISFIYADGQDLWFEPTHWARLEK